jgi:hypothetical protein
MCGFLYYAEVRYSFFRLREIEVTPGNVIPEDVIWQAFPERAASFWPLLMWGNCNFEKGITNYYPVSAKLSVTGWGKYRLTVTPLEIFLGVSWNSNMWWLSEDGRMWLANLPTMTKVRGLTYPDKPILAWDSQLPLPMDQERQTGDIYPSSLPMAKIKKWYDTIDKIEWNKDIYCLIAKRIDGRQVVQILLGDAERIIGEIVVKEDASDWLSLAAALKIQNIYPRPSGEVPRGLSVNATFANNKFTVSERGRM